MKIILRLATLLLVIVPLAAWFVVKPVRVVAPAFFVGRACDHQGVCAEAKEMLPEATALYSEAVEFVCNNIGPLQGHHLQGQQFGVLRRMFMPFWLIEGMAYSLSKHTRTKLAEPWQGYREQFNNWL